MIYLLERLWPVLSVAAALGLLFASLGGRGRGLPSAGWPACLLALALLLAAAFVSAARLVAGAAGLWLDIAVLLGGAYLVGVGAGSLLRRALRRRNEEDEHAATSSSAPDSPAPVGPVNSGAA